MSSAASCPLLTLRPVHVRGLLVVPTAAAAAAAPPGLLRRQPLSALRQQAKIQLPCEVLQGGQSVKQLPSQLKRTLASIPTWSRRRTIMLNPVAAMAPCRCTNTRHCLSMLISLSYIATTPESARNLNFHSMSAWQASTMICALLLAIEGFQLQGTLVALHSSCLQAQSRV